MFVIFVLFFVILMLPGAVRAVEVLPPFVIGRIRWDSYFMGYFAKSHEFQTIDASATLRAAHYMDLKVVYGYVLSVIRQTCFNHITTCHPTTSTLTGGLS